MRTASGTNVMREHGFEKCWPWCQCGWSGRERKLTESNIEKAVADTFRHVKSDAHKRAMRTARR